MAGAVDDEGGGEAFDAEGAAGLHVGVEQGGQVRDVVGGKEGADGVGTRAVGGEGEDGDGRVGGGEAVEGGEFGDAGDAPGGPEVENNGAACPAGHEVFGGAVHGEDGGVGERARGG